MGAVIDGLVETVKGDWASRRLDMVLLMIVQSVVGVVDFTFFQRSKTMARDSTGSIHFSHVIWLRFLKIL